MSTRLDGRSVLLLGATGGIGSSLAHELHARGARLTLVARKADALAALDIEGASLAVDLRSPSAIEAAFSAAEGTFGHVDIVINATGVVAFGPVVELSTDVMEELFLTNTFLPIMVVSAALGRLPADGAIVNFSGVIAEKNLPGMAAYGASKAALRAFGEGAAREARRMKIRVIDARPPHTETGLVTRALAGDAPRFPEGLSPERVAVVVCDALESDVTDLPASAF